VASLRGFAAAFWKHLRAKRAPRANLHRLIGDRSAAWALSVLASLRQLHRINAGFGHEDPFPLHGLNARCPLS
jgi:hypothetical protein